MEQPGNLTRYDGPATARSRKLVAGSVVACILAIGLAIYFVTRPSATLAALQQAVATKNYRAINALVDFPALRTSIKADLVRDIEAGLGPSPSTAAQIGLALGNMLIAPMVDLVVSPLGLAFILEGYTPKEAVSGVQSSGGDKAAQSNQITYETRWDSLSQYAVVIFKQGKPVSTLTLRRYGLFDWKLAGLNLAR